MTPETPDKNNNANGAELPRDNSHRTSHLLPIWSSQISRHLLPAVLRCQGTTTKTATPDLCDKANGSSSHAKIKKPADSWQIYGFSTARKGFVVRYQEVEYVSKYYRHSGYVTTQSKTRASTGSPSPSLFGRFNCWFH